MKRRAFCSAALTASALPLTQASASSNPSLATQKELYEIRIYDMKFGVNAQPVIQYLKEVLQPTFKAAGAKQFLLFDEISNQLPRRIWGLISYPDAATYLQAQTLDSNAPYQEAAKAYRALESVPFNRFESWLLHAFDGLPQMEQLVENASVFEIRTYEGYNEDAVRRKIAMFNDEELPLFYKVKLNPVFFGEMIAGPYRPALTYMLNYESMDAHGQAWKAFLSSPEWNAMKSLPKYANTVSNIRNTFLKPV